MFYSQVIDGSFCDYRRLQYNQRFPDALVLAIPRGGVVVAKEIAKALSLPLSVIIVKKIGLPSNEELALGAVSNDGKPFWNKDVITFHEVSEEYMRKASEKKYSEVKERLKEFGIPAKLDVRNKTIILADDGLATGATMKAAINCLKQQHPKKIIVAVPVSPSDTAKEIIALADEFVCLEIPPFFSAVGQFYDDFREVQNEEVKRILKEYDSVKRT